MKKILTSLIVILFTITTALSNCNFNSYNPYFSVWDSCKSGKTLLSGYIAFNSIHSNCFKYKWKVNGVVVPDSLLLNKRYLQNYRVNPMHPVTDTYTVCCIVMDTCLNCDTSICVTHIVTNCVSCNFSKAGFYYNNQCRHYTFEMGSYIDTCVKYITWRYTPKTGKIDTVSLTRVFTLYFQDTGLYTMKTIIKNTCNGCDTFIYKTIHVTCITSGINNNGHYDIKLYPNPTSQGFYLYTLLEGRYEVYNSLGQLVYSGNTDQVKTYIETINWNDGIYILKMSNYTKEFIKQ